MNVGSLFTGIGGFDLGLERAGMRVVWQCESDDYCRRVLAKHWPHVPCYEDVRDLSSAAGTPRVDVLCGGFPCQDISLAGRGAGIDGARSGLWSEYARLIGELRPRYVIVENVSALLGRGLDRVLGDLSTLGFDAEWDCIPASAVGAPHQRDRVWLVAYPSGSRRREDARGTHGDEGEDAGRAASHDHVASGVGSQRVSAVADAMRDGRRQGRSGRIAWQDPRDEGLSRTDGLAGSDSESPLGFAESRSERGHWESEPDVGRVANGVPHRVDRLRSLGNALVPQIAEWIGRRIMSYEAT